MAKFNYWLFGIWKFASSGLSPTFK